MIPEFQLSTRLNYTSKHRKPLSSLIQYKFLRQKNKQTNKLTYLARSLQMTAARPSALCFTVESQTTVSKEVQNILFVLWEH